MRTYWEKNQYYQRSERVFFIWSFLWFGNFHLIFISCTKIFTISCADWNYLWNHLLQSNNRIVALKKLKISDSNNSLANIHWSLGRILNFLQNLSEHFQNNISSIFYSNWQARDNSTILEIISLRLIGLSHSTFFILHFLSNKTMQFWPILISISFSISATDNLINQFHLLTIRSLTLIQLNSY